MCKPAPTWHCWGRKKRHSRSCRLCCREWTGHKIHELRESGRGIARFCDRRSKEKTRKRNLVRSSFAGWNQGVRIPARKVESCNTHAQSKIESREHIPTASNDASIWKPSSIASYGALHKPDVGKTTRTSRGACFPAPSGLKPQLAAGLLTPSLCCHSRSPERRHPDFEKLGYQQPTKSSEQPPLLAQHGGLRKRRRCEDNSFFSCPPSESEPRVLQKARRRQDLALAT